MESALCYLRAQQLDLALKGCERAAALAPAYAPHRYHLGLARTVAGLRPAAIDAFGAAIRLDPILVDAHLRLGQVLLSLGRKEEAIEEFRATLKLQPGLLEAETCWAEALVELGREDEAEEHLKPIASGDPNLIIGHGVRLQVLGRFAQAQECFLNALAIAPRIGAAYYWLVRGRRMGNEDSALIERMTVLARDQRLPMADKIYLHFGLGKALEDLGDYRQSMNNFDEANGLTAISRNVRFDREGLVKYNDWRIRAFQRRAVEHFQPFGAASDKPIFVIGMIRSGTTLLEQMLSNHPDIAAGGEILYWNERQEAFNSRVSNGSIDGNFIAGVGQEYLELLEKLAPDSRRVIDKMPLNFFLVGPIHVSLPNARLIHVRRSPIDTCLSIYTTFLESFPPFANDQENIVFYYREYLRLMEHWRELLPADRLFEVDYEDLVSRPEETLKRVVAFCGLTWNEACLHPETNRRAVRTPSAWQVRQPTYQTSQERWRHFAPWLGAFKQLAPPD